MVHQPLYLWWTSLFRCTRAQLSGDFDAAERLAGETLAIGQRGHAENALHYYAMAMFNIRREQGRLGEVEAAVANFIEMYPAIPAWRCCQALMHIELGRHDEAREAFESVAAAGFDALPRDANFLIAVTLLAEVCGALGDADRAAELYPLLAPHGGRNVLVGRAASCNGSASRLLGILAGVLGQWEEAERSFAEALEMHVRMGARPWVARTELAWAEMLLARGGPGDEAAARARLAEAIVLADALGMVALAERARALVAGGEPAAALAAVVHRPLYLWWTSLFRCARAQLSGDFETAERLAGETLAIGQRGHAENALHYYAMAMFNIRREQGRLGEVEGAVARFIEMYPAIPAWRCCQALMYIELGRPEAAREAFESVAAAGFDALPRDANWLIAVTLLAEVCGSLGDADRAGELLALLAPHGGRNVLVGRAASCNGSASRLLGILATARGQWEEAERWFAEALEMHVRMGARPWLARTELAWAEMLLARGETGDEVAARRRLAEAIVLADALGMVAVGERARALVTGGEPVRTRA